MCFQAAEKVSLTCVCTEWGQQGTLGFEDPDLVLCGIGQVWPETAAGDQAGSVHCCVPGSPAQSPLSSAWWCALCWGLCAGMPVQRAPCTSVNVQSILRK